VRFNFDYCINTHMPLILRLYGKSISRGIVGTAQS
jgi:hypothetical protein